MARQGTVRTFGITNAIQLFLGARKNRVALTLFPCSTAFDYTISNDPSVAAGGGIFVRNVSVSGSVTVPVVLDAAVVGDLLTQPLYIISTGTATIGFIETIES